MKCQRAEEFFQGCSTELTYFSRPIKHEQPFKQIEREIKQHVFLHAASQSITLLIEKLRIGDRQLQTDAVYINER